MPWTTITVTRITRCHSTAKYPDNLLWMVAVTSWRSSSRRVRHLPIKTARPALHRQTSATIWNARTPRLKPDPLFVTRANCDRNGDGNIDSLDNPLFNDRAVTITRQE